ncbi:hypothetical protein [Comamonas sp. JC664]|uniref:hypothetical protein n=1 Tax=Comamonas sp. JC664 TaxID=2801917 RepID=UPI0017488677|nr:hypothetical protein [Comamonas sp. JC664]MBL0697098.1 hypothetical protein [Comamonas sp. JC664]GHG82491.1 hypothetical protein GCM10012319_36640 [Comamonas sp. KCTC 72670]
MRIMPMSLLCLLVATGCGDDAPQVPKSSLAACSFTDACALAEEACNISQLCGPPAPGEELYCQPEKGDRKCHRRCERDTDCGTGETCREVEASRRTDVMESITLCMG